MLDVRRGDRNLGTVEAGKNAYTAEQQVSNEVGIRSDPLTGEDLFVIAEQVNADGTVFLRVFVKPLVNLIWIAGLLFLLGSLSPSGPTRAKSVASPRGTTRPESPAPRAVALVLAALLAVACVVAVALPFLREPVRAGRRCARRARRRTRRRLELAESRDRALSALKELERITGRGRSPTRTTGRW